LAFDEEYFKSEDFQQLLSSYETSKASGDMMFLDADDIVDIADYYNMMGQPDLALEAVEHGLDIYPGHVLLNVFMARRALDEEDAEEAERIADSIEDKDSPDYHYLRAEILIAQNLIDEADNYLREYALTVAPDEYADFVKDVANLYVDYNVSDKAYEWMMRTTGDDSDDFKELMGRALFGLGKYKDSQRVFNELLDHNPFSKQYWTPLATAQYMDEDYNASITSSEYALAIDPEDPDGLLAKANGLMKLSNFEQAAEYFERYSHICPTDPMGPLHQAACLVNMGRNKEAVVLLQNALTMPLSDELLPQIYQELGFAYSAMGEMDRALDALDKTRELDCDHADMMVIRGHILLCHQHVEEAERAFRQAIIDSENDPNIFLRIIASLFDNHYVSAAYMMMKQFFAAYVDQGFTKGYAYMALCCWELRNKKECLDYLKKAAEANPADTRMVMGYLFPDDLPVTQYYDYLKEHFDTASIYTKDNFDTTNE